MTKSKDPLCPPEADSGTLPRSDLLRPLWHPNEIVRALLHTVPLFSPESEPVKAGSVKVMHAKTNVLFRIMSIECPLLVARRFHILSLQSGAKASAVRFSAASGAPVARWMLDRPPTLEAGEPIELVVMNTGNVEHYFAASLVGATLEKP